MRDKPISDLRRRMIADMTVRSFSEKTQHDYIRHIETFARFLGRSPDTASGDDIRRFQLEQVARLIEAAPGPGLKYKTALSIAYGAGLHGGEVVMLRVGDIDSTRMLIRVELGKGRKDRHAMLSPQLLSLLRAWWLQCRSRGWLFPGQDSLRPITVRQLNRVCHMAAEAAGLRSCNGPGGRGYLPRPRGRLA